MRWRASNARRVSSISSGEAQRVFQGGLHLSHFGHHRDGSSSQMSASGRSQSSANVFRRARKLSAASCPIPRARRSTPLLSGWFFRISSLSLSLQCLDACLQVKCLPSFGFAEFWQFLQEFGSAHDTNLAAAHFIVSGFWAGRGNGVSAPLQASLGTRQSVHQMTASDDAL